MTNQISIVSLMKQDHHDIESLMDTLMESLDGSYDVMKQQFEKFEWKLEKHLFVEEKAIFVFYEPDDVTQGFQMIPTVMSQHNYILNELNILRKTVFNGKNPTNLEKFKIFLEKHRNYEEKDLYPKLEETLPEEKKQMIIERIKEFS